MTNQTTLYAKSQYDRDDNFIGSQTIIKTEKSLIVDYWNPRNEKDYRMYYHLSDVYHLIPVDFDAVINDYGITEIDCLINALGGVTPYRVVTSNYDRYPHVY